MRLSRYEISLQRGAVHMLEAFLKILLLLLLFIIAVAPSWQQVPTLGLLIHLSQEKVLAKKTFHCHRYKETSSFASACRKHDNVYPGPQL